jgi:hypothetical protein
MKDRTNLINRMAEALRTLSDTMLDSGTARWGAYERADLINFNNSARPDPHRINANCSANKEGVIHTPLDRAAVDLEKTRRKHVSDAPRAAMAR